MSIKDKKDAENDEYVNANPHTDAKTRDCITPQARVTQEKKTKTIGAGVNDDNIGLSTSDVNTGIWGGERKVTSIRIDKNVYSSFKPFARRHFGSVCLAVEAWMAGIMGHARNSDVNIGSTINYHGDVNVNRYMKRSRRFESPDSAIFEEDVDRVVGLVYRWYGKRRGRPFSRGEFWQAHKEEVGRLGFPLVKAAAIRLIENDADAKYWLY